MPPYLLEAFLLGLSTGPVCLAYCAPVLVPLVVSEDKYKLARTAGLLGFFLTGRLAGYLTVGLIIGVIGGAVMEHAEGGPMAVVTILMGFVLLAFGSFKNFPEWKLCRIWPGGGKSILWAPILGLATGLNICPPFIAAITGSAALGTISGSLFYFIAFFIGTALYVPPMAALGPLSKIGSINIVAKICLFLAGIWFVFKGIMMLFV